MTLADAWDKPGISFLQDSIFGSSSSPDVGSVPSKCMRYSGVCSSDHCMLFSINLAEHHMSFPDHPARGHPPSLRAAGAIRTNDGILNTPTIEAACGGVESVCFDAQVIEYFPYQ
jgi:hypothetical protein